MNNSNLATRMWFARRKGQILGPFLLTDLRKLHDRGNLALFDEVSEDKTTWHTLQSLYDAASSRQEELASQERSSISIEPVSSGIPMNTGKKGLSTLMWAGIGVMVLLTLASSVLLAYYLLNRPSAVVTNSQPSSLPYVSSVKQEDKLAESVGLVVCGYQLVKESTTIELPVNTGSCFAVSSNGYLVTNKHVINESWKSMNQPLKVDNIRKLFGVDIVRPLIWVFFGKEKLVAELVHVSDLYDMAVLKTNRHDSIYLRLGNGDQLPRGSRVYAVGFLPPAGSKLTNKNSVIHKHD